MKNKIIFIEKMIYKTFLKDPESSGRSEIHSKLRPISITGFRD